MGLRISVVMVWRGIIGNAYASLLGVATIIIPLFIIYWYGRQIVFCFTKVVRDTFI